MFKDLCIKVVYKTKLSLKTLSGNPKDKTDFQKVQHL